MAEDEEFDYLDGIDLEGIEDSEDVDEDSEENSDDENEDDSEDDGKDGESLVTFEKDNISRKIKEVKPARKNDDWGEIKAPILEINNSVSQNPVRENLEESVGGADSSDDSEVSYAPRNSAYVSSGNSYTSSQNYNASNDSYKPRDVRDSGVVLRNFNPSPISSPRIGNVDISEMIVNQESMGNGMRHSGESFEDRVKRYEPNKRDFSKPPRSNDRKVKRFKDLG